MIFATSHRKQNPDKHSTNVSGHPNRSTANPPPTSSSFLKPYQHQPSVEFQPLYHSYCCPCTFGRTYRFLIWWLSALFAVATTYLVLSSSCTAAWLLPSTKKKSATSPSPAPMSGGTNSTLAPPQTHPRYFLFSRLYVFFSVFFVFLVAKKKKYKYGGTKS